MLKSFQQYINEAVQERNGNVKIDSMSGGLEAVVVSLPTQRNPEGIGEITLELYSKGPKTYKFQPTGDLKAQMDIVTSMARSADEKNKDAVEIIDKEVKQLQADITADLLQVFTKLDEDIKAVLKKYNVEA